MPVLPAAGCPAQIYIFAKKRSRMKLSRTHLILPVLCLALGACKTQPETKTYLADNPTSREIELKIDEQTYRIAPKSNQQLPISLGAHLLSYQGHTVKFVVIPCDQEVVINPTLSNYVLYHEVYTGAKEKVAQKEAAALLPAYLHHQALTSGDTLQVPYRVVSDLFIERYKYYWNQGLNEPVQDEIKISGDMGSMSTVFQSKLFREEEFRAYRQLPDDIRFVKTTAAYTDLKPAAVFGDYHFDCSPAQQELDLKKRQYDTLALSRDPAVITRLAGEIRGIYTDQRKLDRQQQVISSCDRRDGSAESLQFDLTRVALARHIADQLGGRNMLIIK